MVDFKDDLKASILDEDIEGIHCQMQRVKGIPHGVDIVRELCPDIVGLACRKGYPDLLEQVHQLHLDITSTRDAQMSGVHLACQYNHVNILEFYQCKEQKILTEDQEIWDDRSPVYLACKFGNNEAVRFLIDHFPSIVKNEDVRSVLLYAACQGGNCDVVKMFLSPGMDVNHSVQLVTTFVKCENMTPLYAACKGGHYNVVTYLAECAEGLELSEAVCKDFPDIIGKFLDDRFSRFYTKSLDEEEDDLFQLHRGALQSLHLFYLHSNWLEPYLVTLVDLDISRNSITELPSCLPWDFQNLKTFNASYNQLKSITFPGSHRDVDDLDYRLEDLNLSHNRLTSVCVELYMIPSLVCLNLSYNKLDILSKSIHQNVELQDSRKSLINRQSQYVKRWMCYRLRKLLVSHNTLQMLPEDIKQCNSLVRLEADHNSLNTFPQPWTCPLEVLNLAYNNLERFPTNIDTFWSASLSYINISNNRLDTIDEGIVKLNMLADLNASKNRIDRLPSVEIWECSNLHHLNLKHNKLGISVTSPKPRFGFRKTRSLTDCDMIALPPCLSHRLKELRLADNNLDCVPLSVCQLHVLEVLDLSNNPLIKTLPRELGKLQNLGLLKLKNVMPKLPDNLAKNFTCEGKYTRDMLADFLDDLRESKPCYKVKAVVLGKKDKGKTSLVNLLANKGLQAQERKSIVRENVILAAKKDFPIPIKRDPDIHLNVWDIAGDEVYTLIHQSMFTRHSLYIIVWDFWSITDEITKISTLVNNIQASTSSASVVLVGTFLDRIALRWDERAASMTRIYTVLEERFTQRGDTAPVFCPVSCVTKEGIDTLRARLYEVCMKMTFYVKHSRQALIGRKIPKSYLVAMEMLDNHQKAMEQDNNPPCLTRGEFVSILESVPCTDFDLTTSEEIEAVTKYLVETGYLLHFADHLGAIDSLYFLDPAWLCDILVHLLISPEGKKQLKTGQGKITRDNVQKIYQESEKFPTKFIEQYLELLERFELAASIKQGKTLFFPSQLPRDPPMIETKESVDPGKIVRRLYLMTECPAGFWSRLLTRMMMRVDQLSQETWAFGPVLTSSVRARSTVRLGSRNNKDSSRNMSCSGLHLKTPTSTFCQEWMKVTHADGSFCVEPVSFQDDVVTGRLHHGVLVTEVNKNEDFGMMGIIVDEIEEIVQDFYPGLLDIDSVTLRERLERYAVCPGCYSRLPLPSQLDHFAVEHCARRLMCGSSMLCPKTGAHNLQVLVPDFLMRELPRHFFMEPSKLEVVENKENMLGGGVAGAVFRGKYDDQPVAVKIYRSDIRNKRRNDSFSQSLSMSSDSGTATMSTQGSNVVEEIYANVADVKRGQSDKEEMECIKAFRALRELRQEVALTSRFRHPCIVSLIGVTFSPKLMMALELVPLGSLRSVLDRQMAGRPSTNKFSPGTDLRTPLFSKELTFKIVHQIAKGLDYLHNHGIVYKDLKSDNILTQSLDLDAAVNVKLSDYGISKYSWGGRSVGLVGTMGYQAPEILEGVAYDEKVDIFSFSMVIYETLTGKRPYAEYENMSQITKALKLEGKRPILKDLNIHTRFPYLEELMRDCWHYKSIERPVTNIIVSKHRMQNLQFLAQAASFNSPADSGIMFESQCIIVASEHGEKCMLWVWEGEGQCRQLSVLDPDWASVCVNRQCYPGPRIICATKVRDHIWVGNMNNEIEVYSANHVELQQLGTFPLDGLPVQIETWKCSKNNFAVYIGLKHGLVLQFMNKTLNRDSGSLGLIKKIKGYQPPKSLYVRCKSTHCIGMIHVQEELWVSNGRYVDIIDCKHFKVDAEKRININVLLTLCQLPKKQYVDQIVCWDRQVFCMLSQSPFILEFDACMHVCTSVMNLDKQFVFGSVVSQQLKFTDYETNAYRGCQDNDVSAGTRSSDEVKEEFSRSFGGSSTETSQRNSNLSSTFEIVGRPEMDESNDVTVPLPVIPPRLPKHDPISPGIMPDTPPVIRRPKPLPSHREYSQYDPPPVPKRPGSVAPPVPRRPRSVGHSSGRGCSPSPPRRPPKPSTLPPNTSFKGHIKALPTPEYSITVTSMAAVKDTLWVGRSCGDICIISTGRYGDASEPTVTLRTEHGKVRANMYDFSNRNLGRKSPERVQLVTMGQHVMAAYTLTEGQQSEVQVAAWDRYTEADIRRVERFWGHIAQIEKEMVQGHARDEAESIVKDVGQF